jgi:hypothetical protein
MWIYTENWLRTEDCFGIPGSLRRRKKSPEEGQDGPKSETAKVGHVKTYVI